MLYTSPGNALIQFSKRPAAMTRRSRVAARPSRAVTPAKEPTTVSLPKRESRGPKALRGLSGQRPDRESRGQRPLVGSRGETPGAYENICSSSSYFSWVISASWVVPFRRTT